MENTKELYNNHLEIAGRITKQPFYTHTVKTANGDVRYCELEIASTRLSQVDDILKVSIQEDMVATLDLEKPIKIIGEVRTANIDTGGEHLTLKVYAFATEAMNCLEEERINTFEATVYLCREPIYRQTPIGKQITDLSLACIRSYKTRSDYFPTIMWGSKARLAKGLQVGQKLYIKGRFQSRAYIKKTPYQEIPRMAYEISVRDFELLD